MHPTLETARLRLRPYGEADIADLVALAGAREVAATTGRIAHPYSEEHAREFLVLANEPDKIWLAITLRGDGRQIGGVGLRVDRHHQHGELGYWLGVPYWGQGYATEAAREMMRYGFDELGLHRIFASHFHNNPASGRILVKLGMRLEGRQRQHFRKWDQFLDVELYGILREEWLAHPGRHPEQSRSSGGARDLPAHEAVAREIPIQRARFAHFLRAGSRPACEKRGPSG